MLTDTDRAILDFETRWQGPDPRGAKDTAIWGEFRVLPARYYQQLGALLLRDDALAYAPLLVGRLRRLREAREKVRTG